MIQDSIKDFHTQLTFKPSLEREERLLKTDKFVVVGMGGSRAAADFVAMRYPELDLIIHSSYGLPAAPGDLSSRLIILNSYSGNTEEVLDALEKARVANLSLAIISAGGVLEELAKNYGIPYIKIPVTGMQPRMALGFSIIALLKLMGKDQEIAELVPLASGLESAEFEGRGKEIAGALSGKVPIIYASAENQALAYNWKTRLNETGKTPAFYNIFPELNHNEMEGFSAGGGSASGGDTPSSIEALTHSFHVIFLTDSTDHPRVQKRMKESQGLLNERGLTSTSVPVEGSSVWAKVFSCLLIADWTAYYLADSYGTEPEKVPLIEEFKKRMVS